MKVTATRPTYVETDKGEALIKNGESADVDGRKYSNSHPFVKAGYLVAEKAEEKPRRKAKAEQTQAKDEPSDSEPSREE